MRLGFCRIAFALAALAVTSAAVRADEKPTVTLGLVAYLSEFWPALIAQKLGYFEQEGIKVDIVITGASARTVQNAALNAINIGAGGMIDPIRGIDGGAQVTLIASGVITSTTMLMTKPEIKTVAELKGKRVIVGGPKDITAVWWAAMAKKAGLDPINDVDLLYAGATPDRGSALMAGGVDAASLSTPTAFMVESKGFKNLGLFAPYMPDLPYIAYYANTAWMQKNRPAVVAFVKGLQRGTAFIYDPKNREEAANVLSEYTKVEHDVAAQTYDLILKIKAFSPDASFTDAGINAVQQVLIDGGDVPPPPKPVATFYDSSYVKDASAKK